MIPFLLRRGHQVGEAIDHHGGLGNDANDDADNVHFCRDEIVREEIPDGIDAQWDINQNGGYKTWIIFTSEDEEHHDVSRGVQRGIVGRPEAPVGAKVVGKHTRERQQHVHQRNVDPERAGLSQRLVRTCGTEWSLVEETQEAGQTYSSNSWNQ